MPDLPDYCRQLETYLCKKNGGHLIRIVGPAFQQVCGWAELGVPLTVAFRGIDRYVERQQSKATARRRPVRIEFCEHDILDLFEDWRRAVGIASGGAADGDTATRRPALTAHFERVVARLVARRSPRSSAFEAHIQGLIAELDRLAGEARHARGDARTAVVERLGALDGDLIEAASTDLSEAERSAARREAEAELAPFVARMTPDVKAQALGAAYERLVRESLGLPLVRYE